LSQLAAQDLKGYKELIYRAADEERREFFVELGITRRVRERGHDELLMNSLKAAFVWGNAGIAQLVQSG